MTDSSQIEFVLETREHLTIFESSMLALESARVQASRLELIGLSLRAIHSVKGNAGFLGFHALAQLAHAIETALEDYRNGAETPPTKLLETVLLGKDSLQTMLDDLAHSDSHDASKLIAQLQSAGAAGSSPAALHFDFELPAASILRLFQSLAALGSLQNVAPTKVSLETQVSQWPSEIRLVGDLSGRATVHEVNRRLAGAGVVVTWEDIGATCLSDQVAEGDLIGWLQRHASDRRAALVYEPDDLAIGVPQAPIVWMTTPPSASPTPPPIVEHVVEQNVEPIVEQVAATPTVPPRSAAIANVTSPKDDKPPTSPASDRPTSLRVQIDLLDELMNLVGELTLVRNQSQLFFGDSEGMAQAVIQRLNSVTSDLQDTVLKTRMQPVENLFGRFPRMVRDLGRQLDKQVELVLVGQDVELDKTVLEQLSDPLTHLIRNSVDHGLETPEGRVSAGKPPVGRVTLSATAADGQVIIEIRDDGRGIDPEAVRSKVIASGLKTEADLQNISLKELYSFVLLPGFSTAKQLSEVSGRGVGMDVVKTNVERLEGSLTIDSTFGTGTSMKLSVPLTLAIIPCLIVTVGEERFAVPQRGLDEIVCLHPGAPAAIEHTYDSEVFRLRDMLLPVVRLSAVLERGERFDEQAKIDVMQANLPYERNPNQIQYILVLRTRGRRFGLLVDDVRGTEEVVAKPMHPSLKHVGIFAGSTLMGDGGVALIANVDGIADHADCWGIEPPDEKVQRDPTDVHRVLLFKYGPKELFAVPLVQVRRIEPVDADEIERVGDQSFVTLDGVSTRIIQLEKMLDVSPAEPSSEMYLLLPKFVAEPMGILLSRIVATESLSIEMQAAAFDDPIILGTAIIHDRLAMFLDTQYLRELTFGAKTRMPKGDLLASAESRLPDPAASLGRTPRVLLVDDTPFFREVVKRYFERENLSVTTAVDGKDGLEKLAGETFDLVVSDIDMPVMDGWQFCSAARQLGNTTPFLALTSLSKADNEVKAAECGFDQFEEKLDHDRLIQAVLDLLQREAMQSL